MASKRKELIDAAVAHALDLLRNNPKTQYLEAIDYQYRFIMEAVDEAIAAVGADENLIGRHVLNNVYAEWLTWKPGTNLPGAMAEATLTTAEAAEVLGVDRTTTYRAASSGKVRGARQEARTGAINPPWVATESAWREWYSNRTPPGRPGKEAQQGGVVS